MSPVLVTLTVPPLALPMAVLVISPPPVKQYGLGADRDRAGISGGTGIALRCDPGGNAAARSVDHQGSRDDRDRSTPARAESYRWRSHCRRTKSI